MANVLVEESSLQDIADSIRAKLSVQTKYKPGEMADAIDSISGGITPTGTISITANGTGIDVAQYAYADVAVPAGITPTGTKQISITANGTTTEDVSEYANAKITVNVSGGGASGAITVASGTFIGNSTSGRQTINIGKKMAKTDFFLLITAQENSEFPVTTQYKFVVLIALCLHDLGQYTLTSDGVCAFTSALTIKENNSGDITDKSAGEIAKYAKYYRNSTFGELANNRFIITRGTDGYFYVETGQSNAVYELTAGITYEYKIVYFGSDAANDIVELS